MFIWYLFVYIETHWSLKLQTNMFGVFRKIQDIGCCMISTEMFCTNSMQGGRMVGGHIKECLLCTLPLWVVEVELGSSGSQLKRLLQLSILNLFSLNFVDIIGNYDFQIKWKWSVLTTQTAGIASYHCQWTQERRKNNSQIGMHPSSCVSLGPSIPKAAWTKDRASLPMWTQLHLRLRWALPSFFLVQWVD